MAKAPKKQRAKQKERDAARALVSKLSAEGKTDGELRLLVGDAFPRLSYRTVRRYVADRYTDTKPSHAQQATAVRLAADRELPSQLDVHRIALKRPDRVAAWSETSSTLTAHAVTILAKAEPDEYRLHGAAAKLCATAAGYEALIVKVLHWDKIAPDYDLSSEEVQAEVTQALEQNVHHFPRDMLARLAHAITAQLAGMPVEDVGGFDDGSGIA